MAMCRMMVRKLQRSEITTAICIKEIIMEKYKNLGGNSNVVGYEISVGEITVQFGDGAVYLYTTQSAGAVSITEMHKLAKAGKGLNSYIGRVVRKGYARKIR